MIFIFQNTKRHLVWQNCSNNETDSSMSQYGGEDKINDSGYTCL